VAELIQSNVRESDHVFRYGGDEFLIVMPETNGSAQNVMARLREAMARWNEQSGLGDLHLGLSMGMAVWDPSEDKSIDELLREADEALYRAKRGHSEI